MKKGIHIRLFTQKDRGPWDRYVTESNESTMYHRIGWKDVIEKSFGHKTFYVVAEDESDNDEIRGVLPLVHFKSMMFGNFLVSLPYFNYGGVCADSDEVRSQLLREAISIAEQGRAKHIELRHTEHIYRDLPVKTAKVTMTLPLPGVSEHLWRSLSSNLRRKIRKATKEGLYLTVGRKEELDNFYTVFCRNMRDLGTPVYSKKFFANILETFREEAWIFTVHNREGIPVASLFLFGFKDRVETPWVSSIRIYNRYYPNLLLYWSSLKFACERGYRIFDFGRSTPEGGTYRFKEQWGARPAQLYWHYWIKDCVPLPEINPGNPKYQLAIRIWQRLPIGITKLIGPMIVKNIP